MCLFTNASDGCLALASVLRWLASQILQANNCARTNDRHSYVNDDRTPHFHSCVRSHYLEVLGETDIMIAQIVLYYLLLIYFFRILYHSFSDLQIIY